MYDLLREVANLEAPIRGIPQESDFEDVEFLNWDVDICDCQDNDEDPSFDWLDDVDFPEFEMQGSDFIGSDSLNFGDYDLFNFLDETLKELGIEPSDEFFDNTNLNDVFNIDKTGRSGRITVTIDIDGLREKLIEFND